MLTTGCPDDLDERMELYCLRRLHPDTAREFERHLAICQGCLEQMLQTHVFLGSLIWALKEPAQIG